MGYVLRGDERKWTRKIQNQLIRPLIECAGILLAKEVQ